MTGGEPRLPGAARLALALAAASIGLHLLLAGAVDLSPQEAYYWQYARHLDLSYFDHPPLAAWTIRLTTALAGASERGVRLAASLHACLFSHFFFLAGRRLFGPAAALAALLAACSVPLFALGQTVITPDAPLLAGWAAALYFTVRALDEERGRWLVAAGAAVGFAALGKYTGWLLAPQLLLALLCDARGRRLLRTPGPWVGLALALALFSPVVIWNARHGWASFGFQVGDRAAAAQAFSAARVLRFVGLQGVLVSPLLLAVVWAAAVASLRRWHEPAFRLCAIFSLPALALFLAVSPFAWVKGNWPAPAYPAALLAAAGLLVARPLPLRKVALASVGSAAAVTAYLHLALVVPSLPFPARDDVTRGWRELAARVETELAALPAGAFVLGCSYKPASQLAWHLRVRPFTVGPSALGEPGLAYAFWDRPGALAGQEGLLVQDARDGRTCQGREERCAPLVELEPLTVRRAKAEVTTFRLWRCRFPPAPAPGPPRLPAGSPAPPPPSLASAPAGSPSRE